MREEMEQRADMEAANIARKGWGLYFWGSKSRGGGGFEILEINRMVSTSIIIINI